MGVRVAVPKETATGERRVALVPDVAKKLVKDGLSVVIEAGAGEASYYPDAAYTDAGVQVAPDTAAVLGGGGIVLKVQPPTPDEVDRMAPGTVVVGLMNPTRALDSVRRMRDRKITAFALEFLPRITRAQSMDVLSSQATIAGYRAALLAAAETPKLLPMLTTAAGTIRPAKVLILGAGVAGLMAIATARRLGAMVEAYDVRRAAGEQVRSLGAKFLELQINAEGAGGYARVLTADEKGPELAMVSTGAAGADAVITRANVPGRRAPRLISKEVAAKMRPGSVIVDLAAESGGNCELTRPGETVVEHDVTVLGPLNLPSQTPFHASQMYSKNLQAFLGLLVTSDGSLVPSFDDEILAASLLISDGVVHHAATRDLLEAAK